MRKINILLPDGDDTRTIKVVQSLGITGRARIFVLTNRGNEARYSRFGTPFSISPGAGKDEINALLGRVLGKYAIDVILPVAEKGIAYIHQNDWLKEWQTALIPDAQAMARVGNKWELHTTLQSLGLDTPQSVLISTATDVDKLDQLKNYPVLIKPTQGAGGFGILFADNYQDLADGIIASFKKNNRKTYLVQQHVQGSDIDISILCFNGALLAYTIQQPISKSANVFTFSKMIQFVEDTQVLEYCRRLVAHLNWTGVAHLDFIRERSGERLFLVDFNPRFWGTMLGSTCAGVNFPYLSCLSALGVTFQLPKYEPIQYYELGRKQIPGFILRRNTNIAASVKNSTIFFFLRDPLPAIMKGLRFKRAD